MRLKLHLQIDLKYKIFLNISNTQAEVRLIRTAIFSVICFSFHPKTPRIMLEKGYAKWM